MFACVVAAQNDIVHLANVHELGATGVADGALGVLLHLDQGVGQIAFDGLQNALAFNVLVLALVEVRSRAVVFFVKLAVHLDSGARRLFVAGQHRANHDHGGAKANALGNVAVLSNAAVGNDGLGRHAGAPLERRQLPATCAKACFEFGDTNLARANPHLGGIGAPSFQINDGFGSAHVASDDERCGQFFFQGVNHFLNTVGMAVGNVDGDVFGRQAFSHQLVDSVVIGAFDAQRNRSEKPFGMHVAHKFDVVEVEAVHDVEVAVLRHPGANLLVHHRLHVGRNHGEAEFTAA